MSKFEDNSNSSNTGQPDPTFQYQIQRLYQLTLYSRWVVVALLWFFITPLSLWGLRHEISLWLDYFTWTALRYGLVYNRLPAFGLALCIGTTLAVLLRQSYYLLFGFSPRQKHQLEKQVLRIRQQGETHPLWKWVCKP